MMAATDPLLGSPEMIPSLTGAALRVGLAIVLLVAGAWALLRWQKRAGKFKRHLRVVDRASLARGASVTLVEVDGRRLLLGVSADGVRLLRDLDRNGSAGSRRSGFHQVLRDVSAGKEARQ
jgi:flagellar biogenesis protein FliO